MPSRYLDRFKMPANAPPLDQTESPDDEKTRKDSDMWRFIGDIAPTAGSLIGGGVGALGAGLVSGGMGAPEGAALGAGLGGLAGQAVGGLAHGHAEEEIRPQEAQATQNKDRRAELMQVLMGLRR